MSLFGAFQPSAFQLNAFQIIADAVQRNGGGRRKKRKRTRRFESESEREQTDAIDFATQQSNRLADAAIVSALRRARDAEIAAQADEGAMVIALMAELI